MVFLGTIGISPVAFFLQCFLFSKNGSIYLFFMFRPSVVLSNSSVCLGTICFSWLVSPSRRLCRAFHPRGISLHRKLIWDIKVPRHQASNTYVLLTIMYTQGYTYPGYVYPTHTYPKYAYPKYIYPGCTYPIYIYPDYVYIRIFYILKVYMPKKHHT
jgi:hypothetical protein